MDDFGSYVEHDGRPAVRFRRSYPHPVERVWTALTDPAESRHWFPSGLELEPRVGGTVRFTGDPYAADQSGEVLAYQPPHRLAFSWGDDELHLSLEPTSAGCALTLIDVLGARNQAARNGAGWQVCLAELTKWLAGEPSGGPHSDSALPWQPTYRAYLEAGLPAGAEVPDLA